MAENQMTEEIVPENVEDSDEEDFTNFTPEQLQSGSEAQFKEGKELLDQGKFEEAVLSLQRALTMRVARFGELDINCASYYLEYGKSLLKVVQKNSGLLGDQNSKPVDSTPSSAPPKKEPADSSKQVESEAKIDQFADDRQLAWENVEIARVILSRSDRAEDQATLASCHETCGDIFLENDRYGEAANEYLQAAKIHESVAGKGSRCAAGDWVSAAVSSVFDNKSQEGYAFYMEALSNLDYRIRSLIGQPLEDEDEDELVLLDPEVLEQWISENNDHKDLEEVKEIWEFCCEISERLEGFSDVENVQANQEDVQKIVQEMLAAEMAKLAQTQDDAEDEPVNDLGVVKRKSDVNKRTLENASEPPLKKQKLAD